VLRRKVVGEGETVPVGALLGVVADASTSDAEVEAFVADFLANFKVTAKSGDSGPQPEMIEAGGKKLRHLRVGPDSGTPVVFIHGFGGDYLTWAFNQGTVGEDRPAYAVELPGHGGSTKDVGDATVETFAATVAAYLDAIGAKRPHLVGHSLGGAIAITIALNAPDKVGALSLISPSGFGKEISDAFISGYIRESRPRKLRPVLEMLVADPSLVTAQMVEDTLKFKRLDGAVAALEKIAAVNFPAGKQSIWLRDRIGEIKAPIQVMWGVADHVVPVSQADGLPASIKVTRIADAGHIPHIEKADEVSKLVQALA
jgi:pyruvate dehydrogenase E2 component (dihydrolipoamide acetyltransferase)